MARFLLTYSPIHGLIFLWDNGQGLPEFLRQSLLSLPEQDQPLHKPAYSPALPVLTALDYPPNKIACNCEKCGRRVLKGQGYKQNAYKGFYCDQCQYEQDQPLRSDASGVADAGA